jgi:hypothetical protein
MGRTRAGGDLRGGFRQGTVQEFCGLSDAEMAEIDARIDAEQAAKRLKVALGRCVLEKRQQQGVSPTELARRIGASRARIGAIEGGWASFDLIMRALLALGLSQLEIAEIVRNAG